MRLTYFCQDVSFAFRFLRLDMQFTESRGDYSWAFFLLIFVAGIPRAAEVLPGRFPRGDKGVTREARGDHLRLKQVSLSCLEGRG
jgi:hypothetical protein